MVTRVSFKVEGLDGVLKTLKELPPEIVSKRGGPVRASLRKAAQVIQQQEIENLRVIIAQPNPSGVDKSSGLLEKNIVVTRGRLRSGENGEKYLVRIRGKRYSQKGGKPVVTQQVARLLEYGSERLDPPRPFIRPAFEAKKNEAVNVFVTEINKRVQRIVKRLQTKNRVKE